jgi:hypothetical protein
MAHMYNTTHVQGYLLMKGFLFMGNDASRDTDPVLRSYIPRLACKCGTFPLFTTLFCNGGYVYFTAVLT